VRRPAAHWLNRKPHRPLGRGRQRQRRIGQPRRPGAYPRATSFRARVHTTLPRFCKTMLGNRHVEHPPLPGGIAIHRYPLPPLTGTWGSQAPYGRSVHVLMGRVRTEVERFRFPRRPWDAGRGGTRQPGGMSIGWKPFGGTCRAGARETVVRPCWCRLGHPAPRHAIGLGRRRVCRHGLDALLSRLQAPSGPCVTPPSRCPAAPRLSRLSRALSARGLHGA
jgi:hypothetical protein